MKLIAHELVTTLSQKITMSRDLMTYAIRPHLIKYGAPTGSLIISIKSESGDLLAQSSAVTVESITDEDYFHGEVRFLISNPLREGVSYNIELSSTGGYAYDFSNFIGWCNAYDLAKVGSSYSPSSGLNAPLLMEIWERKTVSRE